MDSNDYYNISYRANHIAKFNRHFPQEKVYLHMDNRCYFVGDTLFFKAYVMNATTHSPTRISEVLYVELLNEKGVEVEHKKLKIVGGSCEGSFILEDNYRTGYYEIRSYTRHMLNFGNEEMPWINVHKYLDERALDPYVVSEDGYTGGISQIFSTLIWRQSLVADANHCQFSRVFPVYMKPEKAGVYRHEMDWCPMHTGLAFPEETEEELRNDSLRVDFYPEGGSLVADIPSRVAVEVSDQWGREKSIGGCITEGGSSKDTIVTFRAGHRGRGIFTFTPEWGKQYYAHINYKGRTYRYAFPEAKKSGYTMRITAPIAQGDASFIVNASNINDELIGYTLQCRGALVVFDTLRLGDDGTVHNVSIPSDKLIPGVNQLTLFNTRGEVLAERLFFVSPPKGQPTLNLISQLPDSLQPFQKVTLDFQANASNGYFTQAHFSISVTDAAERGETFDTGDIRSELLLSSDLKGFIKDVDSYFFHTNDTVMRDDIDLLMMVQGWRRYEWRTMAGVVPYTPRYTPEYGLQLDGYVVADDAPEVNFADAGSYKRLGNLDLHVDMKDPLITISETFEVDSLGEFHVDFGKDFFGEIPITLTLSETDGKVRKDGLYSRLKFAYPIIYRAFSPATTPYGYYQDHSPEDDELRTAINDYDWQVEVNIENVDVKRRYKQKGEIYLERPDIIVDYYKEWNNTIDRGVPSANIYYSSNIFNEEASNKGIVTKEDNYIRMNYTLARNRLWGYNSRFEDEQYTYNPGRNKRFRVYLMPKTINIYTNLISRRSTGEPIDKKTNTRPDYYWMPPYFKRSESPQYAPYMLKDGVRKTYYEGYSRVVSYYHRDYSGDELPDSADYRRTLYWNPSITTTPMGKVQLTFYNNARAKHLHIRAEGFTRYGELIVYDSEKERL